LYFFSFPPFDCEAPVSLLPKVLNWLMELMDSFEWFNIASAAMSVAGMMTLLVISSDVNCMLVPAPDPSLLATLPGVLGRSFSISFQPAVDETKLLIVLGTRASNLNEA
jgi:hypothetical protein